MTCPLCSSQTREGVIGEYCLKCGLLIDSFYDASPRFKFKRKLKAKTNRGQRRIDKKIKKCEACGDTEDLTIHHIIPKRENPETKVVMVLCRRCHNIADKVTELVYPLAINSKEKK